MRAELGFRFDPKNEADDDGIHQWTSVLLGRNTGFWHVKRWDENGHIRSTLSVPPQNYSHPYYQYTIQHVTYIRKVSVSPPEHLSFQNEYFPFGLRNRRTFSILHNGSFDCSPSSITISPCHTSRKPRDSNIHFRARDKMSTTYAHEFDNANQPR